MRHDPHLFTPSLAAPQNLVETSETVAATPGSGDPDDGNTNVYNAVSTNSAITLLSQRLNSIISEDEELARLDVVGQTRAAQSFASTPMHLLAPSAKRGRRFSEVNAPMAEEAAFSEQVCEGRGGAAAQCGCV